MIPGLYAYAQRLKSVQLSGLVICHSLSIALKLKFFFSWRKDVFLALDALQLGVFSNGFLTNQIKWNVEAFLDPKFYTWFSGGHFIFNIYCIFLNSDKKACRQMMKRWEECFVVFCLSQEPFFPTVFVATKADTVLKSHVCVTNTYHTNFCSLMLINVPLCGTFLVSNLALAHSHTFIHWWQWWIFMHTPCQ